MEQNMFTLGDVADILDSALDTGISIVDALAKLSDLADEGSLGSAKGIKFEGQPESVYDENGNIIASDNFVNNENQNVILSDDSGVVCSGNSINFSKKSSANTRCNGTVQPYKDAVDVDLGKYQGNHHLSGGRKEHETFDDALLETFQRRGTYVLPSAKTRTNCNDNILDGIPVFQAFGNLCHIADDVLKYNGDELQQDYDNNIETSSDALNLKVNDMLLSFQKLDATVEKLKLQAMQQHLISHPEDEVILNTHQHSFDGICPVPNDNLSNSDPCTPVTLRKPSKKRPSTYILDSSSSSPIIEGHSNMKFVDSELYCNLEGVADHSYSRQTSQETYILDDDDTECDSHASLSGDERIKTSLPKNDSRSRNSRDTYVLLNSKDNLKSVDKSGRNSLLVSSPTNAEDSESLHQQHSGRSVFNKIHLPFYQEKSNDVSVNNELKQDHRLLKKDEPIFKKQSMTEDVHKMERNTSCRQTYVLCDPLKLSSSHQINGDTKSDDNSTFFHKKLNGASKRINNSTFFRKKNKVSKENQNSNRQTYVLCKPGKNKNRLKTENMKNGFDKKSEESDKLIQADKSDNNLIKTNMYGNFTRSDVRSTYILSKTCNSTTHNTKETSKTADKIDERNAEHVEEGAITILPLQSKFQTYTENIEKSENNRSTNIILENNKGGSPEEEKVVDEFKKCEKRSTYVLHSNHKKGNTKKHMKSEFLKNANKNKNNDEVIFYVGKKQNKSNDTFDKKLDGSLFTETMPKLDSSMITETMPKLDGSLITETMPKLDGSLITETMPKLDGSLITETTPKLDSSLITETTTKLNGLLIMETTTKLDEPKLLCNQPKEEFDLLISSKINDENKSHLNHPHPFSDQNLSVIASTSATCCETSMDEFELLYEVNNPCVENINQTRPKSGNTYNVSSESDNTSHNVSSESGNTSYNVSGDEAPEVESLREFELIYEIAVPPNKNIEINKRNSGIKNSFSECKRNSINNSDRIIQDAKSSPEEFVFNNIQREEEMNQVDSISPDGDKNCECANYIISRENTFVKDEISNNSSEIDIESHFIIPQHISKENLVVEDGLLVECSTIKDEENEMKSVELLNDASSDILSDVSYEILSDVSSEIINDICDEKLSGACDEILNASTEIVNKTPSDLLNDEWGGILNDGSSKIHLDSSNEIHLDSSSEINLDSSSEIINDSSSEILSDASSEINDISISDDHGLNSKPTKLYCRAASLDTLIDTRSSTRQPYNRSFSNPSSSEIRNEFHNSRKTLFKKLDTLQNIMSSSLTKLNTLTYFCEKKNSTNSFVLSSHNNICGETVKEFDTRPSISKSTDNLYSHKFDTRPSISKSTDNLYSHKFDPMCSSKHFLASLDEELSSEPVVEKDALHSLLDQDEDVSEGGVKSSTPNSSKPPFYITDETHILVSDNTSTFNASSGIFPQKVKSFEEEDYFPETYTIKSNTSSMEEISQFEDESICQPLSHKHQEDIFTTFSLEKSKLLPLSGLFFSTAETSDQNRGPLPGKSPVCRSDTFVLSPRDDKKSKHNNSNISRNDTFLIDKNSKHKQSSESVCSAPKKSMGEYQSNDKAIISRRPFSAASFQTPRCETFQKPKKRNAYSDSCSSKTHSSDPPFNPTSFFYTLQTTSVTPSMTSSKPAEKKKLMYSNEYFECSKNKTKDEDVLFYSPKIVEKVQCMSNHKPNKIELYEKKISRKKCEEKANRRISETTPTHKNFLRRKSEGYSKQKLQKKESEDETLSIQLAALRMQLEEKRRKFDEEKKRKQEQWRQERAKNLQNAFYIMLNNEEEKPVDLSMTSVESENLKEFTCEPQHDKNVCDDDVVLQSDNVICEKTSYVIGNTSNQEDAEDNEDIQWLGNSYRSATDEMDQISQNTNFISNIPQSNLFMDNLSMVTMQAEQHMTPMESEETHHNMNEVDDRPLSTLMQEFSPFTKPDVLPIKPIGYSTPDTISSVLNQLGTIDALHNTPFNQVELSTVLNQLGNNPTEYNNVIEQNVEDMKTYSVNECVERESNHHNTSNTVQKPYSLSYIEKAPQELTIDSVLEEVAPIYSHIDIFPNDETPLVDENMYSNIPHDLHTPQKPKFEEIVGIRDEEENVFTIATNNEEDYFSEQLRTPHADDVENPENSIPEKVSDVLSHENIVKPPTAMTFSVGVDMMGCPELTPQQIKKREKFLRQRQKNMVEEKEKKAVELEKKQRMEESTPKKTTKEERLKEISHSQKTPNDSNNFYQESGMKIFGTDQETPTTPSRKCKRDVTTPRTPRTIPHTPSSTNSTADEASRYAEYTGPDAYKKPSGKSNRKIIQNAIMHCCLCGEVNKESKKKCLDAMEKSEANHFLVLFREGLKFRSVYEYHPENETVSRVYGIGPKTINEKMMIKYYKYNSGGKEFYSLETKHLSIQVEGLMIKKELWEKKQANSSKTDSNLKKFIGNNQK